jgi:hypothetical protein
MTTYHYATRSIEYLHTSLKPQSRIRQAAWTQIELDKSTRIALKTVWLARFLGIDAPSDSDAPRIPYGEGDRLAFDAPLTSQLVQTNFWFLRGWRQFQGCIKGFNGLGLMAEQVDRVEAELRTFSDERINSLYGDYLASRRSPSGQVVFPDAVSDRDIKIARSALTLAELAIWVAFARKTIVCSTSSNMGISLHEAIRLLQARTVRLAEKEWKHFNADEGSLIIWCPDERADFMNAEKAEILRTIEAETPQITTLRTYINRQQRDPGALSDALNLGGYFFPTNPQSVSEIQNLLFLSLTSNGADPEEAVTAALRNSLQRETLTSLGCSFDELNGAIEVTRGVEGGIHGLMVPYFLLYEEMLADGKPIRLSTWNQASIGAALAAAVLADDVVRNPDRLLPDTRAVFEAEFPNLGIIGRDSDSRQLIDESTLHGVFDIANIQSLAQLLGVVVTRHLSGRSTAYVGLGSSSYSNGNRCFEILDTSASNRASFKGRNTFHPATHTINPVAQAIIYGEEVLRAAAHAKSVSASAGEIADVVHRYVRKPEPAGAAALAGFLLNRLDTESLSIFEIVFLLRYFGFEKQSFLRFCNLSPTLEAEEAFIQMSQEEGPYMGQFMADLLEIFGWPLGDVHRAAVAEAKSRPLPAGESAKLDDVKFDRTVIYLTGDNCAQPDVALVADLLDVHRQVVEAGYSLSLRAES